MVDEYSSLTIEELKDLIRIWKKNKLDENKIKDHIWQNPIHVSDLGNLYIYFKKLNKHLLNNLSKYKRISIEMENIIEDLSKNPTKLNQLKLEELKRIMRATGLKGISKNKNEIKSIIKKKLLK